MAARVYPHIPARLTAGRGSSVSTVRNPELDKRKQRDGRMSEMYLCNDGEVNELHSSTNLIQICDF